MNTMASWVRLNAVERLVHEGRTDEALEAAERGFAEVGGAALGCRYARLLAAAGRVDDAVPVLRRVVDAGAGGLWAARDLAVLQRDRLDDPKAARRTCLRGLTGSMSDVPEAGPGRGRVPAGTP